MSIREIALPQQMMARKKAQVPFSRHRKWKRGSQGLCQILFSLTAPSLCLSLFLYLSFRLAHSECQSWRSFGRPTGRNRKKWRRRRWCARPGSVGEVGKSRKISGFSPGERMLEVAKRADEARDTHTPGSRMRPSSSASRMFDVFFSHRSTLRRTPSSSLNPAAIARRSAATTTVPCNVREHRSLADDSPRLVPACPRDRHRGQ